MKKQWVRRSMRKALTMITLTSTIALVSPMMIQTGTVAYAVAQDQAVVLADNTVGHLSYSYQADEQNIYWSLDVQEKISNESAYVRLKIDSVDTVSVAGQSFAKDESGWIDLDTLSLGTAVQQVTFSTLKTDDQTLAVTAELVVPGEGEVKDEIHPIVTGGKLEADVPLVTELPDVDPGITAEKEDTVEIPAPEQIEEDTLGDSEASPEENASDTESSKQGMMSASPDASVVQAADEGLEIGSRAVYGTIRDTITKNTDSTNLSDSSQTMGNKYIEAGDTVKIVTTFSLNNQNRNHKWSINLDPSVFDLPDSASQASNQQKIQITGLDSHSWSYSSGKLTTGNLTAGSSYQNKAYTITLIVKVKSDLSLDNNKHLELGNGVNWTNSNGSSTSGTKFWVKAAPSVTTTNSITSNGSDISVASGGTVGNKYAHNGSEITFTSQFNANPNKSGYKWKATLDANTIDLNRGIKVYKKVGNDAEVNIPVTVSNNTIVLDIPDNERNQNISYRIVTFAQGNITETGKQGSFKTEVYPSGTTSGTPTTGYYWVKGDIFSLRNTIVNEAGENIVSNATTFTDGTPHVNAGEKVIFTSKFTPRAPSSQNEQRRNFKWSVTIDSEVIDIDTVEVYQGNNLIARGSNFTGDSYTAPTISSAGNNETSYRVEAKTLSSITTNKQGSFTAKVDYQKGTWRPGGPGGGSWGNWSNETPITRTDKFWVKAQVDKPTTLTWDDKEIERVGTRDRADDDVYSTNFQWTDDDEDDLKEGKLGFEVRDKDGVKVSFATAVWVSKGEGKLTLPAKVFDYYGEKSFFVYATKGQKDVGGPIKLTITVNGSLKLISVPSALAWTGTLSDQEQILSRNERMAVAVQDSRATGKGKGSFTLTMNSDSADDDFSFVWKDTNTSPVVPMENHTLGRTAFDDDAYTYTYTASYGTGAGILVKTNSNTAIQTTTRTITWTLNNTWTGS